MGCSCSIHTPQELEIQSSLPCNEWSTGLIGPKDWPVQDGSHRDANVCSVDVEQEGASSRHVRNWSVGCNEADVTLLSLSRVAAGHGGTSILKYVERTATEVPESPMYVMKVWDDVEARVYQELRTTNDALLPFTAGFCGEVDAADLSPGLDSRYMRLTNVLHGFRECPNVMDCKLGIRSFTEGEVSKTKLRPDLFQKLMKLDPSAPTEEEKKAGACTKYRWMSQNDARSTLPSLGFRIDGIETNKGKTDKEDLRTVSNLSDAAAMMAEEFLPALVTSSDSLSTTDTGDLAVTPSTEGGFALGAAEQVLKSLKDLRKAMSASEFVRKHTFIGCSLLFVADDCGTNAGVYLIDFAHTTPLPEGVTVDHRRPWQVGNHEDGILTGMDNMIECWEQVVTRLSSGCCTESW